MLLRISASRTGPGHYLAQFFADDRAKPAAETRFVLAVDGPGTSHLTPSALSSALTTDRQFLDEVTRLLTKPSSASLLLDLRAPALFTAPWERLTELPPFALGWPGPGHRPVVRYSPDPTPLALVPVALPVDIVVAEMRGWTGAPFEAFAHPLKHFRAVFGNRLDVRRLRELLRSSSHDIVHVRGTASWQDGEVVVDVPPGEGLRAADLRRLVRSGPSPARLVILETDTASLPAMTTVGHVISRRDGPAVLVWVGSAAALDQFYYAIIHDRPFDEALADAKRQAAPDATVLILHRGGEEALRLTPAARDLAAKSQRELGRLRLTLMDMNSVMATSPPGLETSSLEASRDILQTAELDLTQLGQRAFSFVQEIQGIEPLTLTSVEYDGLIAVIDRATLDATRLVPARPVVNTGMASRDRPSTPLDQALPLLWVTSTSSGWRSRSRSQARSRRCRSVSPKNSPLARRA